MNYCLKVLPATVTDTLENETSETDAVCPPGHLPGVGSVVVTQPVVLPLLTGTIKVWLPFAVLTRPGATLPPLFVQIVVMVEVKFTVSCV